MALKALKLRKQIDLKKKELAALMEARAALDAKEAELERAIEEVGNAEDQKTVDAEVEQFEADRKENDEAIEGLERAIGDIEKELEDEERAQETEPAQSEQRNAAPAAETREVRTIMKTRALNAMSITERAAFAAREDVKAYLAEVRDSIREKRALTNVGLTIPEVMMGMLRENIEDYSKLYKHVNVRPIRGEGRQIIMGTIPEAVWTECCANLNELSLGFNDAEVDCYKVAGYFAICNANIEDSDIDLADEVLLAIGQAIGLALDKAILYGRNTSTNSKMPLGIVSRLVQTAQPSGYPATARTWVDLHTTNVKALGTTQSPLTGAALMKAFILAAGAAKGQYSRGEKVWVMNETTYTKLIAEFMTINANGAIVTGINGVMPVVGGIIEVLNFIPDDVVIGGYFDLYLLAERRGQQFATSEHVRFLQDQTVFKGTARYDGQPVIAEGFVAVGIAGTAPTSTMTFAADTANAGE